MLTIRYWADNGARSLTVTVPDRRTACAPATVNAGATETGRRWRCSLLTPAPR